MKKVKINGSWLECMVGDITKQDTDAIVNAANQRLIPGGGVDGAIHRAAGPGLYQECKTLGGCRTGDAKLTRGYNLDSKYVIHTVGPRYSGIKKDKEDLASCYRTSLKIVRENNIRSVSFPAISTGIFGFPIESCADIMIDSTIAYIEIEDTKLEKIIYCLYGQEAFNIFKNKLESL